MRNVTRSLAVFVLALGTGFGPASRALAQLKEQPVPQALPQEATAVPVKIVVLYSSGVGFFEHHGKVNGNASTELRFKTGQINDILKSLVIEDTAKGSGAATVTYPSQDPLEKTLKSFQIDITDNPSLPQLLNQLRGARVTLSITVEAEPITATVLGVEQRLRPGGKDEKPIEVWFLNLLTDAGLVRSIELDSMRDMRILDPQLREELSKALAALAQARDQDKKPVVIQFRGDAERAVKIGYVVETPIWKTSYRLIMGVDDKDKSLLHGWAIVENQTDSDWNNVQLSLVSGRPISFIQDLYQPLYIPRPVVTPELYASLRPQEYSGGMAPMQRPVPPAAPSAPARASMMKSARGRVLNGSAEAAKDSLSNAEHELMVRGGEATRMEMGASAQSIASGAKLGELFEYTVPGVSLTRQRSAMLPIIAEPIAVERVSIYNASVLPRNPLYGARVKNTTDKHLLQGPVTVYDANAYAGDARIENIPPGQERLLSYGIDLEVLVDATKNTRSDVVTAGRIVKGILHITRKHVFAQDYLIANNAAKPKTIIIEQARLEGWKLTKPEKPSETTEEVIRFRQPVKAAESVKLTVEQERVDSQAIAILPMDLGQIQLYARTGEIPDDVRAVLSRAAELKQAMVETQRQIQQREKQVQEITADQQRIRENMKAVDRTAKYYTRLLTDLNDQETTLSNLRGEIRDLQQKLAAQQEELERFLSTASVS